MRRDYLISFVAEGVAVALALLVYRVAAAQWPVDVFGEYALSRRIASAVLVVALVGADIGIVRFVAFEAAGRAADAAGYLRGALITVTAASAALAVILVVLAGPLAGLLFGGPGHDALPPALAVAALGGALQGVAYGHERGHLRMGRAAALLVINTGVVPLAAVLVARDSVAAVLVVMGLGWAAVGSAAIAASGGLLRAPTRVSPLVRYGAPRAAGLLSQMALLAAPAVVAAHRSGIAQAGDVAFALLLLGVFSTALTPVGVVLMPRSAAMLRDGPSGDLNRHVGRLLSLVLPLVTLAVLAVQVLAEQIAAAFLGEAHIGAALALRSLIWAAIPWACFVTLRGLLDAHDARPLNARNTFVAGAVYAALAGAAAAFDGPASAFYVAFVAATAVLAGLTLVDARRALARPRLAQAVVQQPLQP